MDKVENIVVLIHISNAYLSEGIAQLIKQSAGKEYNVLIKNQIDRDSVSLANIIILPKSAINCLFCFSALDYRQKQSIVIGIDDGGLPETRLQIPSCLPGMIVIPRACPLDKVSKIFLMSMLRISTDTGEYLSLPACKSRSLSARQKEFAGLFIAGYDMHLIARILNVSVKTVYSYKLQTMKKFNLARTHDLYEFLVNYMKKQKIKTTIAVSQ
ncbi:LuxR C-terminal-related transcriptional regulator [Pantoea sp. BAV 3049]|uniref:helix-turn-helix transcriptional regulator n=1 Tax=Pantoea sp. BAV 3049 TaxID=2654188 RepID=UPI00131C134D|nr:LuxR C-terminal-related transcriptional regulator [Pantoea sp. BAV 3049]